MKKGRTHLPSPLNSAFLVQNTFPLVASLNTDILRLISATVHKNTGRAFKHKLQGTKQSPSHLLVKQSMLLSEQASKHLC